MFSLMRRPILLLCATLTLLSAADEPSNSSPDRAGPATINGIPVPPSPGDPIAHPGTRIWQPPTFTHWPGIVFEDEERNLAFSLPVPPDRELDRQAKLDRPDGAYHNPFGWQVGDSGTIGWQDGEALPITLPQNPELDRVSGLLGLPTKPGIHTAEVVFGEHSATFQLRVASIREPWPAVSLVNGFPVDADGVPLVLVDQRRDPNVERQWSALRKGDPRPTSGPVWLVGDPLASADGDAWEGVAAERLEAMDLRAPHHAALVALAPLGEVIPRTICWSPGNAAVHSHTWSPEEERLLGAIASRCETLGVRPRLVLLLPPLPLDENLREVAAQRRHLLRRSAVFTGWEVIDAAVVCGEPEQATQLAPGLHTRYPVGKARQALASTLAEALAE